MRCRAVVAAAVSLCATSALAEQLPLRPLDARDGSRDDSVVYCSTPSGWRSIGIDYGYSASFVPEGARLSPEHHVFLHVEAFHLGHADAWDASARHSYRALSIIHDGEITDCKTVASFDAGLNGRLRLWRLRTSADDYYLACFRRGDTVVEVYLRAHDLDELASRITALQEAARSVRIQPKA
jgi:hypothetical protein